MIIMVNIGLELESNMHNKRGKIARNSRKRNKEFISEFVQMEKEIRKKVPAYRLKHDIEAGYRQVELKNAFKCQPCEAAKEMLFSMLSLSEHLNEEGYIMPINETLLAKYDARARMTANNLIDAREIGSKRAKMLIPFLIRFFERMDDEGKMLFELNAKDDIDYLECVKNSTTLNSGMHVNLDLKEVKINGKQLLERVNGKNGSYRYVATDFEYIKMLEKVLFAITPFVITHTSISPYIPVAALTQCGQNKARSMYGNDVIAIDTGGTSARIMLMYSLNPKIGRESDVCVYGHASYLKYWNLMRVNSFHKSMLELSVNDGKSPFHSYGSILGLSRYLLDRFGLVGIPEKNNQNPDIAMHWLPISHPYAYPKSIGNGDGARPALEYKLMGGSVEGVLCSVLLSEIFRISLKCNIAMRDVDHIQFDSKSRTIVIPKNEFVMRKIKKSIAKRNSRALNKYITKSADSLRKMLDDKYIAVLDRVLQRKPYLRVIELAQGKEYINEEDAVRIIKEINMQNNTLMISDLNFLKTVF